MKYSWVWPVAAPLTKCIELLAAFDAFGDDLEPQRMRRVDHSADHERIGVAAVDSVDEAAVDLDGV
jgi:hypothetical protein